VKFFSYCTLSFHLEKVSERYYILVLDIDGIYVKWSNYSVTISVLDIDGIYDISVLDIDGIYDSSVT
jgi:hypothetical protein